jgi:hypothetical protein
MDWLMHYTLANPITEKRVWLLLYLKNKKFIYETSFKIIK